ncbi:MAG: bifunctional diguanylate cyclase/phosphodiesterase [Micromonosporaceae bacterium]|nr:bifunctional diguanylate cyclase/phosphodiesterase [Micromonosporaceae bacterium]
MAVPARAGQAAVVIQRPCTLLVVAVVSTSVGLMVGTGALPGRWLDTGHSPGMLWLMIGCCTVAFAEWGRLRVRVGSAITELTWGETAFIVICVFLPAGWVPATSLVGALSAYTMLGLLDQRRTAMEILHATATVTVASTAGMVVARGLTATYGTSVAGYTMIALIAGAVVYTLVTLYLAALQMTQGRRRPATELFTRLFASKLPMLIGNVTIGLLIVMVEGAGRRWLMLLLPPVGWLLQQAYGYRLRSDDERWTWQLFSDVTAELNRLDEKDTAVAGVSGALRLFPAMKVEVIVNGQGDGPTRTYVGERHGTIAEGPSDRLVSAGWRSLPIEPRALVVGGMQIGEIRLRLATPVRFSRRDRHMLAAYGDALAAALHDAATHRKLRIIAERSTYEAAHDSLTGVVNRAELLTRGAALLDQMGSDASVALLLLDINHFKEVNNALGHIAGDALLHAIALRLEDLVQGEELLARLGGDEFAILMVMGSTDPLHAAIERAELLAAGVAAPAEVAGVVLSVEASVGIVVALAGEVDMTELLRRADIAMYQAKRGPRPVAWYEPLQDEASVDRLALLVEVRTALAARDQLQLVMQPTVALETGKPIGAEVLVRWDHPRRGRLAPSDFLDAIEHSELVGAFTRYMLDRSLEIAGQWVAAGLDMPIAVNVSARSLLDPTLADDLPKLLKQYGVRPDHLTLEITESVVLTELTVVEEVLAALRAVGVRIAVDDFGSGFSSLTFLARVPVDEVKIDQTFVARMIESTEAAAIVRTTVDLGRQLGLRVVAEGVETDAQCVALRSLGCVAAQGFHFYHPLSPERAAVVLMEGNRRST